MNVVCNKLLIVLMCSLVVSLYMWNRLLLLMLLQVEEITERFDFSVTSPLKSESRLDSTNAIK